MLRHKAIRLEALACDDPPDRVSWTGPDGEEMFPDWHDHLYADLQRYRLRDWAAAVAAFEANPDDFHAAYHYLLTHPIHYRFQPWKNQDLPLYHERHLLDDQGLEVVHVMVVKVDPKTRHIEKGEARNTKTMIWLEGGPWLWGSDCDPSDDSYEYLQPHGIGCHDFRLDVGADTFEQAIIKLARKVHRHYGNDRRRVAW